MVIGQNTFLFLFDQNDLIDNSNKNKLTFMFGDASVPVPVPPNCRQPIFINYESNNIDFNCLCDPIDYTSNNVNIKCKTIYICPDVFWKESPPGEALFNIDCNDEDVFWKESPPGEASFDIDCTCVEEDDDGPSAPILLENIRNYYGFSSVSAFSIDFNNNEFYFGYNSAFSIYVADMRISTNAYFGFASEYGLTVQKYFAGSSYFGYQSAGAVLYNPYNEFFNNKEDSAKSYFGNTLSNIIVFNPYHEFFEDKTHYAESRFGYESKNNQFIYDPYHEFFEDKNDSARHYFGFEAKNNQFVFDPYNELFNIGENGSFSFGYEAKNTQFVYNPYNELGPTNPFVLGFQSNSWIRYSDDPYITKLDIPFNIGFSSNTDIKLSNIYFAIVGRSYFGMESTSDAYISIGFITNSYFGYESRLRYLTKGQHYATFNSCIAGFGYALHNNMQRPFFIDLSANQCCSITPLQLKRVEMLDEHEIDVRYGLDKGWGLAMTIEFATEPRLSVSMHAGFTSKVEDNAVYLGESYAGFGNSVNVRGMYIDGDTELGYGNFIIEQNEIKIEMTKPLDPAEINYATYSGFSSIILLGAAYAIYPYSNYFGQSSNFTLTVEEALRGNFHFGFYSRGELNRRATLYPNLLPMGFSVRAAFYEPPYYMYQGFVAHCEALITENWVEFLEEGELDNNYVIPDKNGDPDLDRPQGESIEGYQYMRVIKSRCF